MTIDRRCKFLADQADQKLEDGLWALGVSFPEVLDGDFYRFHDERGEDGKAETVTTNPTVLHGHVAIDAGFDFGSFLIHGF